METNTFWQEEWKPIEFDFEFTNDCRFEVSNFGRVRSFNKVSDGRILKGTMVNGYHFVRMQLYKPRSEKVQKKFDILKEEISVLYKKRKDKIAAKACFSEIKKLTSEIERKRKSLSKKLKHNFNQRKINHHFVVHRLVATYFLPPRKPEETIVGHLDYDKLNNRVSNLKWMTFEENLEHQRRSPYPRPNRKPKYKGLKLTTTQVMHIKMQLKRKRPVKQIARQFSISEMQVWRIKSGENWSHVVIPE